MKIIDLLKRLGVIRYGTKSGTYKSAKDMPTELFMDDVYDAKKDLVAKNNSSTEQKEGSIRDCNK